MSAAQAFVPMVRELAFESGRSFRVEPIRAAQLPRLMPLLGALRGAMAGVPDGAEPAVVVEAVLTGCPDAALDVVAVTVNCDRGVVDSLALDELIDLAVAAFEVNADFFIRRLMPVVTAALSRMAQVATPAVA